MGMTGGLVQASEAEILRLRMNPAELPEFIEGNEWAPPVREVRPKGILGWLLRLTPITIEEVDPDAVPPEGALSGDSRPHLDLDKAWHPLHYLLSETAWEGDEPGCYLVSGGESLCDEDLGYSSIRALTPSEVRRFDDFLSSLSHDTLRKRFDPPRMVALGIYQRPRTREKPRTNDDLEHLLEAFDGLRVFVTSAARAGAGAIVYLA